MIKKDEEYEVVFRRFRKDKSTGAVLDAHKFGLKAWPIKVPKVKD